MNDVEVVKTFIKAIETQHIDEAKQHLSGDFVMRGWTPQPLNKSQFLNLVMALKKNVPDTMFHLDNFQETPESAQTDRVEADMDVTGTLTNDVQLPPDALSSGPDGRKKVVLPRQHVSFSIMAEVVENMIAVPVSGGDLVGIIAQLSKNAEGESIPTIDTHTDEQWGNHYADKKGYNPKQAEEYAKHSSLYDPKGKTYTPSPDPGNAPQVDAAEIERRKKDDPLAPLFETSDEQIEATKRETERNPTPLETLHEDDRRE